MSSDGSDQKRLTSHRGMDSQPVWSPKADKIAFVSADPGSQPQIYVMNPDGTGRDWLVCCAPHTAFAWSPNGTRIAYSAAGNVWTVEVANRSNARMLTRTEQAEVAPVWSPDGNKLAYELWWSGYEGSGDSSDIVLDKLDGSIPQTLTSGPGKKTRPAWSPQGDKLMFTSTADGNEEIYVVTVATRTVRNLTAHPASDRSPVWSPDGSKIAFVSNRDENSKIYVMNADGSELRKVTNSPGDGDKPVWSPDGTKFAFQSYRDGNYEIYTMNADGTGLTNLTDNPGHDEEPSWSPK